MGHDGSLDVPVGPVGPVGGPSDRKATQSPASPNPRKPSRPIASPQRILPEKLNERRKLHFKPSKLTKLKVKESISLRLFFRILARFVNIFIFDKYMWPSWHNSWNPLGRSGTRTHTDRQTDRPTDRQREREREIDRYLYIYIIYIYTYRLERHKHTNLPAPGSKTSRPLRSSSWRKLPAPNNACDHTLFCREFHEERAFRKIIKMWMKNLLVPQRPVEACGIGILCNASEIHPSPKRNGSIP